jgi:hypothetical protein
MTHVEMLDFSAMELMTSGQDIWNFNASKGNCRCDGCNKEDEHLAISGTMDSQLPGRHMSGFVGKNERPMVCLNIAQPQAPICPNMISYSH